MILKCNDCGLAISIQEEGDYIVLSETERLPKRLLTKSGILNCPFCKKIMEIEE